MISKGNQRGGGRQLATHLLNEFDNEQVEVLDLRGAAAPDLHGAFAEWYAQSRATRCEKYLYSLSVNPDHEKYDLSREQYLDFIARTERSLKLLNQPRAVVLHRKNGREHIHVVWSRIDVAEMKAVHMTKDRMILRRVVQEFARAHGLELPRGLRENGGKERFNARAKQSSLAEKQQQERSGVSKDRQRAIITALWEKWPYNPQLFVRDLEHAGYILACGRDAAEKSGKPQPPRYVVVDRAGETHALARQIAGVRTKEIKAYLARDYPLDQLPDVEQAKTRQLEAIAKIPDPREPEKTRQPQEPPRDTRAEDLASRQQERRAPLLAELTEADARHEKERAALAGLHLSENRGILTERAMHQPGPLRAFVLRITGFSMLIGAKHRREDAARAKAQALQAEALKGRHDRELADIERRLSALDAIDARESLSLATALKREAFQRALAPHDRRDLIAEIGRMVEIEPDIIEPVATPPVSAPEVKPAFTRAGPASTPARDDTRTPFGKLKGLFNLVRDTVVPPVKPEFQKAADPVPEKPVDTCGDSALDRARRAAAEIRRREQEHKSRDRDSGRDR